MTGLAKQARILAKNVRAIEGVKPCSRQINYRIKGERGLVLVVHPSGRKVWFVRYQVGRSKSRRQHWHEIGELCELHIPCEGVRGGEAHNFPSRRRRRPQQTRTDNI